MREKVGKVDGEDGIFWMTLKDYIKNFEDTSFALEADYNKYKHS